VRDFLIALRDFPRGAAAQQPSTAATLVTRFRFSGPIVAGKFQFSGTSDSGRWTGKEREAIEVTEAQIAFILQQSEEGTAVGEVCRKAGISEATFYNWRKK
jgi:hypothetical protein